jgi:hypothetical protein
VLHDATHCIKSGKCDRCDEGERVKLPQPLRTEHGVQELADAEGGASGECANKECTEIPAPVSCSQMPTKYGNANTARENSSQHSRPMTCKRTEDAKNDLGGGLRENGSDDGRAIHHHRGAIISIAETALSQERKSGRSPPRRPLASSQEAKGSISPRIASSSPSYSVAGTAETVPSPVRFRLLFWRRGPSPARQAPDVTGGRPRSPQRRSLKAARLRSGPTIGRATDQGKGSGG